MNLKPGATNQVVFHSMYKEEDVKIVKAAD